MIIGKGPDDNEHMMLEPPPQSQEEMGALRRRAEERAAFFDAKYDEFKQLYPDEFVAVREGCVVDHDADLGALDDRLNHQGWGVQDVWVEFIRTNWLLIL